MVTDLMICHVRPDRGHHAGEVGAQLRQPAFEGGVPTERDEDIGEIDAGCGYRNFDLPRSWWNSFERNEFHRLEVTRSANLQAHTVALVVDLGGSPLLSAQRSGAQTRRVPLAISPCGLVFLGPREQLLCQLLAVGVLVHVDLGGAKMRMFGADHPHQASQSRLLQIGSLAGQHRLSVTGHEVQAAARQ